MTMDRAGSIKKLTAQKRKEKAAETGLAGPNFAVSLLAVSPGLDHHELMNCLQTRQNLRRPRSPPETWKKAGARC
jgi:hypothetical protein